MDKRPELYAIQEPETAATPMSRAVLHLSGIRSHGPATPRPVGRPWPTQVDWSTFLRRAKKIAD